MKIEQKKAKKKEIGYFDLSKMEYGVVVTIYIGCEDHSVHLHWHYILACTHTIQILYKLLGKFTTLYRLIYDLLA